MISINEKNKIEKEIRAQEFCPVCATRKQKDCVVCWDCWRIWKFMNNNTDFPKKENALKKFFKWFDEISKI